MADQSRRDFIKVTALTVAAGSLPLSRMPRPDDPGGGDKGVAPFALGITSYTFRAFTLDESIEMTKRLGIKRLALKEMHLPLKSSEEEIKAAVEKIQSAGLELSSCGVVYITNEQEVSNAFRYAKAAGLKMFVGVPEERLLGLVERHAKESDIALAIHNHGPTDERYPSPESAYKLIAAMDKRMGLCIDVGHTQRLGLDPSVEVERFSDRLLDIHMRDVSSADANGTTMEIGRGVIDIPRLLKKLSQLNYSRTIHFEHEKDQKDPLPGLAESVGYVRGVLATM